MNKKYDAIIIGSGLGGLLAGAILVKNGYKPLLIEKLSFFGGKFTSFNYNGFQVPSGAFHALPGGMHGNIGGILKYLNLNVEFIEPSPPFMISNENKRYLLPLKLKEMQMLFSRDSFIFDLSLKEKIQIVYIFYRMLYTKSHIPDVKLSSYILKNTKSKKIYALFNRIITFTNGTSIEDASAIDVVTSLRQQNKHFEGILKGGCKVLVNTLIEYIEKGNGDLLNNAQVNKIIIDDGRAVGVSTYDNGDYYGDIIVSNVGPSETVKILGDNCPNWLYEKYKRTIPAYGIAYSICTEEPLLDHSSVELPIDLENIAGYIQISNADPTLSPDGMHYLLAYQSIDHSTGIDVEKELESGLEDIFKKFPNLSKENIFNISIYRDGWPAANTQQRYDQYGKDRYPIIVTGVKKLYMISHDSEGFGFAAEVIGDAIKTFDRIIKEGLYHE